MNTYSSKNIDHFFGKRSFTYALLNEIIDKIKTDLGMELVPHPTLVDASKDNLKKSAK